MASTEARFVEAFRVEALKVQLEELDDTIQQLEKTLHQKREERTGIIRALEAATNVSASDPFIHRLPIEILAEIFRHISHDQRLRNITLMRVCNHWLNVVSSTAVLWNDIELEIKSPAHTGHLLAYANVCLERSKTAELAITLRIEQFDVVQEAYEKMVASIDAALPRDAEGLQGVMDYYQKGVWMVSGDCFTFTRVTLIAVILALRGDNDRFAGRWARLTWDIGRTSWDRSETWFIWKALTCGTSNLKHVHISGDYLWDNNDVPPSNFGNVQSLRLKGDVTPPPSFYIGLPRLQQLSLFLTEELSMSMVLEPLSSPPFAALQYLHCDASAHGWLTVHNFSIIHLPALVSLSLLGGLYRHILKYIDAPLLERLAIYDVRRTRVIDNSAIPTLPLVNRLQWRAYTSKEEALDPRLLEMILKLPQLERVYSGWGPSIISSAKVEETIAHLAREGGTKARVMTEEEARVEPFQIPLFWDEELGDCSD